jgi:hypothetical protein
MSFEVIVENGFYMLSFILKVSEKETIALSVECALFQDNETPHLLHCSYLSYLSHLLVPTEEPLDHSFSDSYSSLLLTWQFASASVSTAAYSTLHQIT